MSALPSFFRSGTAEETSLASPDEDYSRIASDGRSESTRERISPIPTAAEVTVYRTERRWSGIDVFLRLPFDLPVTDMFTVRIYALTHGDRALVATGRYGPQAEAQIPTARHIAAHRGGADFFEVTLAFNDIPIVTETDCEVSIFASDNLPPPPEGVGCVPIALGGLATSSVSTLIVAPDAQIVSLIATQLVAGPRWVQFFDQGSLPIAGGTAPIFSLGFPAGIGQTRAEMDLARLFASRRFRNGIAMGISSTGDLFTAGAAGDVAAQAWIR